MITPIIASIVIVLVAAFAYNRVVVRRNRVHAAWSQIDIQLRRRHDLIPGLVAAVQGFMAHERALLQSLAEARARAMAAGSDVAPRARAESNLDTSLLSLTGAVQAMPELHADESVQILQEELRSAEGRIAFARQHYDDSVMHYNTAIASVPGNVVAALCGFKPATFFSTRDTVSD